MFVFVLFLFAIKLLEFFIYFGINPLSDMICKYFLQEYDQLDMRMEKDNKRLK